MEVSHAGATLEGGHVCPDSSSLPPCVCVCVCVCSEYYHYRQAWIPLRWLPSESVFEDDFSTKSDVWAFGVLMWEVFSYGELPHSKLSDDEMLEGQRGDWLPCFSSVF